MVSKQYTAHQEPTITSTLTVLGTTRTQILKQLREKPQTAINLATLLRMQVSAARKHLQRLEELGFIKEEYRQEGVGRPKKFYRITDRGRELFPRLYDKVLNATLSKTIKMQGSGKAETIMNEIASDIAATVETHHDKIGNLTKALNELGFEASFTKTPRSYTILSRNCPLLSTALMHKQVVCRGLHEELYKQILQTQELRREKWIVDGDSVCKHIIPT